MLILTYGYKKPQAGDRGAVFWPALEEDIQQLNDHTHNGVDSAKISTASIIAVTQSISSIGWVDLGDGTFKQTVTMPSGLFYDDYGIVMKLDIGDIIYPTVVKVTNVSYDVYINDSTANLVANYV